MSRDALPLEHIIPAFRIAMHGEGPAPADATPNAQLPGANFFALGAVHEEVGLATFRRRFVRNGICSGRPLVYLGQLQVGHGFAEGLRRTGWIRFFRGFFGNDTVQAAFAVRLKVFRWRRNCRPGLDRVNNRLLAEVTFLLGKNIFDYL